ncbi:MAG: hypothetical protein AAF547_03545 [Actinomycetota bacterium]
MTDVMSPETDAADQGPEPTTTDRALARISVTAPYFDLTDLVELGQGIVAATVPPAPTVAPETGPMEAAQVARHLAILGSCAAALSRDDDARHHYLATRAHYSRVSNARPAVDEPLRAEAIASWVDRRTARALVKLTTAAGEALNVLDVEYTVLAPRMFARLNPPCETAAAAPDAGPLRFDVVGGDDGVTVDCGPIPVDLCAGHFPDHPAAPVAIVMGELCRAAGHGLARHLQIPDLRYRIEEGHVQATGLAQAGQHLVLRTRYAEPVRGGHRVTGEALADGAVIGELSVTMSTSVPVPEPAPDHDDDALDDWQEAGAALDGAFPC